MSAKLHPGRTLDEARAACKSWPGVLGRSIVVLPLLRADAEPGVTELDLDVLVVQQADNGNTERGIITSRLFEQKVLLEDAGRIDDIRIDTTRYALAAGAPAGLAASQRPQVARARRLGGLRRGHGRR